MPEISDAELRDFARYQNLGTPAEVSKKINDLEVDNRKYRKEVVPALEAKLPKEDEVVLKKSEADLLPKYTKLGEPTEVQALIEKGAKAQEELTQMQRRGSASAFAKVAGLAEETVDTLIAIPALQNAVFSIKKKDDEEKPYIRLDDKDLSFEEAQEQIPALKGLRPAETPRHSFLKQSGETGKPGGTVFDRIRANREAELKSAAEKPKTLSVEERLGVSVNS
jgi:hypothetical protein